MCEPLSAIASIAAIAGSLASVGSAAAGLFGGSKSQPTAAAPVAPPQSSVTPDAKTVRANTTGAPETGPGGGIATTLLTGPQGVDSSKLNLGKTMLLGG